MVQSERGIMFDKSNLFVLRDVEGVTDTPHPPNHVTCNFMLDTICTPTRLIFMTNVAMLVGAFSHRDQHPHASDDGSHRALHAHEAQKEEGKRIQRHSLIVISILITSIFTSIFTCMNMIP